MKTYIKKYKNSHIHVLPRKRR